MIFFRNNTIGIIGDTHGVDNFLRVIKGVNITDTDFVHIGDVGVGFSSNDRYNLGEIDIALAEKNNRVFLIRGNHDNPSWWDEFKYSNNLNFVPDWMVGVFPNGKYALMIGGAVSIDRSSRTPGISWWEGEELSPPLDHMRGDYDYLFSHSTCSFFNVSVKSLGETMSYWIERDKHLKEDCEWERNTLTDIMVKHNIKVNVYGHFHQYLNEQVVYEGVERRGICVGIDEIYELNTDRV